FLQPHHPGPERQGTSVSASNAVIKIFVAGAAGVPDLTHGRSGSVTPLLVEKRAAQEPWIVAPQNERWLLFHRSTAQFGGSDRRNRSGAGARGRGPRPSHGARRRPLSGCLP